MALVMIAHDSLPSSVLLLWHPSATRFENNNNIFSINGALPRLICMANASPVPTSAGYSDLVSTVEIVGRAFPLSANATPSTSGIKIDIDALRPNSDTTGPIRIAALYADNITSPTADPYFIQLSTIVSDALTAAVYAANNGIGYGDDGTGVGELGINGREVEILWLPVNTSFFPATELHNNKNTSQDSSSSSSTNNTNSSLPFYSVADGRYYGTNVSALIEELTVGYAAKANVSALFGLFGDVTVLEATPALEHAGLMGFSPVVTGASGGSGDNSVTPSISSSSTSSFSKSVLFSRPHTEIELLAIVTELVVKRQLRRIGFAHAEGQIYSQSAMRKLEELLAPFHLSITGVFSLPETVLSLDGMGGADLDIETAVNASWPAFETKNPQAVVVLLMPSRATTLFLERCIAHFRGANHEHDVTDADSPATLSSMSLVSPATPFVIATGFGLISTLVALIPKLSSQPIAAGLLASFSSGVVNDTIAIVVTQPAADVLSSPSDPNLMDFYSKLSTVPAEELYHSTDYYGLDEFIAAQSSSSIGSYSNSAFVTSSMAVASFIDAQIMLRSLAAAGRNTSRHRVSRVSMDNVVVRLHGASFGVYTDDCDAFGGTPSYSSSSSSTAVGGASCRNNKGAHGVRLVSLNTTSGSPLKGSVSLMRTPLTMMAVSPAALPRELIFYVSTTLTAGNSSGSSSSQFLLSPLVEDFKKSFVAAANSVTSTILGTNVSNSNSISSSAVCSAGTLHFAEADKVAVAALLETLVKEASDPTASSSSTTLLLTSLREIETVVGNRQVSAIVGGITNFDEIFGMANKNSSSSQYVFAKSVPIVSPRSLHPRLWPSSANFSRNVVSFAPTLQQEFVAAAAGLYSQWTRASQSSPVTGGIPSNPTVSDISSDRVMLVVSDHPGGWSSGEGEAQTIPFLVIKKNNTHNINSNTPISPPLGLSGYEEMKTIFERSLNTNLMRLSTSVYLAAPTAATSSSGSSSSISPLAQWIRDNSDAIVSGGGGTLFIIGLSSLPTDGDIDAILYLLKESATRSGIINNNNNSITNNTNTNTSTRLPVRVVLPFSTVELHYSALNATIAGGVASGDIPLCVADNILFSTALPMWSEMSAAASSSSSTVNSVYQKWRKLALTIGSEVKPTPASLSAFFTHAALSAVAERITSPRQATAREVLDEIYKLSTISVGATSSSSVKSASSATYSIAAAHIVAEERSTYTLEMNRNSPLSRGFGVSSTSSEDPNAGVFDVTDGSVVYGPYTTHPCGDHSATTTTSSSTFTTTATTGICQVNYPTLPMRFLPLSAALGLRNPSAEELDTYTPSTMYSFRDLPTDAAGRAGESGVDTTTVAIILGAVLGSVFLLICIAVLLYCLFGTALKVLLGTPGAGSFDRDLNNAPKDSTKPFTIMFTDIQRSTSLWAEIPELMGEAIDAHHTIIRTLIKKHKGYEVKTIGDAFMIAFKSAKDAVNLGFELQQEFFKYDFNGVAEIDRCLREFEMQTIAEQDDDADVTAFAALSCYLNEDQYNKSWRGVRVRVGLHTSLGEIKLDPVTHAYDYYGTISNVAARVEAAAHGGQVVCTDASRKAYLEALAEEANGGKKKEQTTKLVTLSGSRVGLKDDMGPAGGDSGINIVIPEMGALPSRFADDFDDDDSVAVVGRNSVANSVMKPPLNINGSVFGASVAGSEGASTQVTTKNGNLTVVNASAMTKSSSNNMAAAAAAAAKNNTGYNAKGEPIIVFTDLGYNVLRGVPDPMWLHQIETIAGRKFGPLRVEVPPVNQEEEEEEDGGSSQPESQSKQIAKDLQRLTDMTVAILKTTFSPMPPKKRMTDFKALCKTWRVRGRSIESWKKKLAANDEAEETRFLHGGGGGPTVRNGPTAANMTPSGVELNINAANAMNTIGGGKVSPFNGQQDGHGTNADSQKFKNFGGQSVAGTVKGFNQTAKNKMIEEEAYIYSVAPLVAAVAIKKLTKTQAAIIGLGAGSNGAQSVADTYTQARRFNVSPKQTPVDFNNNLSFAQTPMHGGPRAHSGFSGVGAGSRGSPTNAGGVNPALTYGFGAGGPLGGASNIVSAFSNTVDESAHVSQHFSSIGLGIGHTSVSRLNFLGGGGGNNNAANNLNPSHVATGLESASAFLSSLPGGVSPLGVSRVGAANANGHLFNAAGDEDVNNTSGAAAAALFMGARNSKTTNGNLVGSAGNTNTNNNVVSHINISAANGTNSNNLNTAAAGRQLSSGDDIVPALSASLLRTNNNTTNNTGGSAVGFAFPIDAAAAAGANALTSAGGQPSGGSSVYNNNNNSYNGNFTVTSSSVNNYFAAITNTNNRNYSTSSTSALPKGLYQHTDTLLRETIKWNLLANTDAAFPEKKAPEDAAKRYSALLENLRIGGIGNAATNASRRSLLGQTDEKFKEERRKLLAAHGMVNNTNHLPPTTTSEDEAKERLKNIMAFQFPELYGGGGGGAGTTANVASGGNVAMALGFASGGPIPGVLPPATGHLTAACAFSDAEQTEKDRKKKAAALEKEHGMVSGYDSLPPATTSEWEASERIKKIMADQFQALYSTTPPPQPQRADQQRHTNHPTGLTIQPPKSADHSPASSSPVTLVGAPASSPNAVAAVSAAAAATEGGQKLFNAESHGMVSGLDGLPPASSSEEEAKERLKALLFPQSNTSAGTKAPAVPNSTASAALQPPTAVVRISPTPTGSALTTPNLGPSDLRATLSVSGGGGGGTMSSQLIFREFGEGLPPPVATEAEAVDRLKKLLHFELYEGGLFRPIGAPHPNQQQKQQQNQQYLSTPPPPPHSGLSSESTNTTTLNNSSYDDAIRVAEDINHQGDNKQGLSVGRKATITPGSGFPSSALHLQRKTTGGHYTPRVPSSRDHTSVPSPIHANTPLTAHTIGPIHGGENSSSNPNLLGATAATTVIEDNNHMALVSVSSNSNIFVPMVPPSAGATHATAYGQSLGKLPTPAVPAHSSGNEVASPKLCGGAMGGGAGTDLFLAMASTNAAGAPPSRRISNVLLASESNHNNVLAIDEHAALAGTLAGSGLYFNGAVSYNTARNTLGTSASNSYSNPALANTSAFAGSVSNHNGLLGGTSKQTPLFGKNLPPITNNSFTVPATNNNNTNNTNINASFSTAPHSDAKESPPEIVKNEEGSPISLAAALAERNDERGCSKAAGAGRGSGDEALMSMLMGSSTTMATTTNTVGTATTHGLTNNNSTNETVIDVVAHLHPHKDEITVTQPTPLVNRLPSPLPQQQQQQQNGKWTSHYTSTNSHSAPPHTFVSSPNRRKSGGGGGFPRITSYDTIGSPAMGNLTRAPSHAPTIGSGGGRTARELNLQ